MTSRRSALKATFAAVATAGAVSGQPHTVNELWVNPASGADTNGGAKVSPLRSLAEAARRVNQSAGEGAATIVLTEGIHAIGETTLLKRERRTSTKTARLTIRAEVLPDDPEWHSGRMPTLIHTMPLPKTWNGRPDPLGACKSIDSSLGVTFFRV